MKLIVCMFFSVTLSEFLAYSSRGGQDKRRVEVCGEKRTPIPYFWPGMVQSRRSSECYRRAGCTVLIAIHVVMLNCWRLQSLQYGCGVCYGVNLQSSFSEVGRKFGLGCFLNSAESLCSRSMEQTWMLGQDRKIVMYSETGEMWNSRSCEKGGFTLRKKWAISYYLSLFMGRRGTGKKK